MIHYITRVTQLLYHAVGEMGMYRKTRLNFGSLAKDRTGGSRDLDEETRSLMEAQSERLYSETKAVLQSLKPLTEHLVERLLEAGEMGLAEVLSEIRNFEAHDPSQEPGKQASTNTINYIAHS